MDTYEFCTNAANLAMELATDLRNIREYSKQGKTSIVAELLIEAENKHHELGACLQSIRGVGKRGQIIDMKA